MTAFREGDVVRRSRLDGRGDVARVDEVRGDYVGTNAWAAHSSTLTLLRRPVRVGDALRRPASGGRQVADDITVRHIGEWIAAGWTHEDGTPIDVPGEAAKVEPTCGHQNRTSTGCGTCKGMALQSFEAAKGNVEVGYVGDPGPQSRYTITGLRDGSGRFVPVPGARKMAESVEFDPVTDTVSGKKYRVIEARNNRLSDECGALRTERDELLRENAVLRRKVEKLERKR